MIDKIKIMIEVQTAQLEELEIARSVALESDEKTVMFGDFEATVFEVEDAIDSLTIARDAYQHYLKAVENPDAAKGACDYLMARAEFHGL